jgi:CRP-like cAMP-binding protein
MLQAQLSTASSSAEWRQVLEEVYSGRDLHPYTSGQVIPMRPQDVLIVCRGVVQLSTLYPTGDEAILGLACPSMPFGLPFTRLRPYNAIALADVDLMRLNLMEVEQSPLLAQGIFRQLNRRLQQTEAVLAMAGQRRVEDRLRYLLLLLAQEMGQPTENGTRISIRLTHQQLANAIGTTRVTVTRLLGQLRDEGWLSFDKVRHLILASTSVPF